MPLAWNHSAECWPQLNKTIVLYCDNDIFLVNSTTDYRGEKIFRFVHNDDICYVSDPKCFMWTYIDDVHYELNRVVANEQIQPEYYSRLNVAPDKSKTILYFNLDEACLVEAKWHKQQHIWYDTHELDTRGKIISADFRFYAYVDKEDDPHVHEENIPRYYYEEETPPNTFREIIAFDIAFNIWRDLIYDEYNRDWVYYENGEMIDAPYFKFYCYADKKPHLVMP